MFDFILITAVLLIYERHGNNTRYYNFILIVIFQIFFKNLNFSYPFVDNIFSYSYNALWREKLLIVIR